VSSNDLMIPPDVERTYARRMKATTQEVAGSHVAFISHPDVAARIIEEAARGAASLRLFSPTSRHPLGRRLRVLTLAGHSSILRSIKALSSAQRIDMRAFLPTLFAARIFVTAVALALSVTATAQELLALTGHKGSVTSVAFSPDGRTIVSGSDD
jgi:WD40 repeat protein